MKNRNYTQFKEVYGMVSYVIFNSVYSSMKLRIFMLIFLAFTYIL